METQNLAAAAAVPLAALGAAAAMAFASSTPLGAATTPIGKVLTSSTGFSAAGNAGLIEGRGVLVAGNRYVVSLSGPAVTALTGRPSSSSGGSTSTNTRW